MNELFKRLRYVAHPFPALLAACLGCLLPGPKQVSPAFRPTREMA